MNTLNIDLREASGVPFYKQIESQIREQILSGRLPVGTLLPSVRSLSKELRVSTITTRRAYSDLSAAGFIEQQRGKGTFVRTPPSGSDETAKKEAFDNLEIALKQALELGHPPEQLLNHIQNLINEIKNS